MLRMSKLADYGTVIMTAMARDPDAVHSSSGLVGATGVPAHTVAKVLKMLARGGVIASQRGASGGYLLCRVPARITLAEIIAAVDGPIGVTECSALPGLCDQEAACAVRANWQKVNRLIGEALAQVTLADMAGPTLRTVDLTAIRARPVTLRRHPARLAHAAPAAAAARKPTDGEPA